MQFDVSSFLIGAVVGVVVAFILRLQALKMLDLKLDRIGINLGIEGFDKKDAVPGVSLNNISGQVGDVAGRDLNKEVNQNSNFYKTVQAATNDAIRSATTNKEHSRGNSDAPTIQRTNRLQLKTDDPQFEKRLSNISSSGGNRWFEEYIAACISNVVFRNQIKQKLDELESEGWTPRTIRPSDNIQKGLLIEIVSDKPFQ